MDDGDRLRFIALVGRAVKPLMLMQPRPISETVRPLPDLMCLHNCYLWIEYAQKASEDRRSILARSCLILRDARG